MCIGIPGEIIEISDATNNLGIMDIRGSRRQINLALIVDADHPIESCVGDWAVIYMGLAMNRVDKAEADKILELLTELGEAQLKMDASLTQRPE